MRFPHLLILLLSLHQVADIHLLEPPLAPKQSQKITPPVASGSHQDTISVEFHVKVVFHPNHAVQDRHDHLLQKDSKHHPYKECTYPKQDILPLIQTGDLLLLHTDQKIDPEFTAPLFKHEPYHVIDQPRHDQYNEEGCKSHKRHHQTGHLKHLFNVPGEDQAVKCEHQCRHEGHSQEIHQIIPGRTPDIPKCKFT